MSVDEINQAIEYIKGDKVVRGALITGGDPVMDLEKLFYLLDRLTEVKNIYEVRVGTRSFLYQPKLFSKELSRRFARYNFRNPDDPNESKSIAFNVHFNHPDELTKEVIEACDNFISQGIILRNQTVLLKGINDDIETMSTLIQKLLRNRIIPYYMNHCMPVIGGDHLRCSVKRGQDIYKHLCTESSTAIPNYVYAPQGGKEHVGADTIFSYKYENGKRYIVVKMLYTANEFQKITGHSLPPRHTVSEDGFIIGEYLDGSDEEIDILNKEQVVYSMQSNVLAYT